MPLTALQARDRYIFGSLAMFLDRTVKQGYDIECAATALAGSLSARFPTPLTIVPGRPDDITVVRKAPSIAITTMSSGEKLRFFELGSATIWRHRSYLLSCFPSLDATGAPCDVAHQLLRSYIQEAFETECIRILDYTNPLFSDTSLVYTQDLMYIQAVSDPIDRSNTTALAEEKHRFDMHVTVRFAVIGSLAT